MRLLRDRKNTIRIYFFINFKSMYRQSSCSNPCMHAQLVAIWTARLLISYLFLCVNMFMKKERSFFTWNTQRSTWCCLWEWAFEHHVHACGMHLSTRPHLLTPTRMTLSLWIFYSFLPMTCLISNSNFFLPPPSYLLLSGPLVALWKHTAYHGNRPHFMSTSSAHVKTN